MVARIEAERDLTRSIVHCDLDMFYAAVELKRDPSLKGKAFGVGKGVLVTASYEARQFGVRSGMANHIAMALCPHLISVPNDMASYVAASKQVMSIFRRYDSNLAQASLDEAYLDITDYCRVNELSVDDAVADLRRAIREETGLTVSVGVASNTMLAKIGSDKNKPDGQFLLPATKEAAIDFMESLSVRKVPGIGRVTERILGAIGVITCGDIWTLRVRIALVLGDGTLFWLLKYKLGIGSSIVEPGKREERKTVGREHTFQPTSDPKRLFELLRESCNTVESDLAKLDFVAKRVTLTAKHADFQRFTRDQTQTSYVSKADEIYAVTSALLEHELRVQPGLTLRLIGARVGTLKDVRKPADGGPLKKLWKEGGQGGAANGKRRRIKRDSNDPDSVTGEDSRSGLLSGDEDEEDDELQRALAASLAEYNSSKANQASVEDDSGEADPPDIQDKAAEWEHSPPIERSALGLAQALHRATPEVLHPPPPSRANGSDSHLADLEEDSSDTGTATPDADDSSNAPPAKQGWFSKALNPAESSPGSSSTTAATSSSLEPMICPVCSQAVPVRFGSTATGRNAQLNKHVDECLRGQQAGPADEARTSSAAATGRKTKRSSAPTLKGDGRAVKKKKKNKGALDKFFAK